MGRAVCVLDGQNMRRGISRDLGFTVADRSENLRRSAEVAKLLNDAGLICLAAFLAPEEAVRQKAAEVVGRERFLVVHLDAPRGGLPRTRPGRALRQGRRGRNRQLPRRERPVRDAAAA